MKSREAYLERTSRDSFLADAKSKDVKLSNISKKQNRRGFRGKNNKLPKKSAKAKARDIKRLLTKKSEELPAEAVKALRDRATALESEALNARREIKRKKFLSKRKQLYDKIRFYESQKVRRKIKTVRKLLQNLLKQQREAFKNNDKKSDDITGMAAAIAEHQVALGKYLDDLNYIIRYPPDEPYVALFPSGKTESAETEKKRQAIREKIRRQVLEERLKEVPIAGVEDEESNDLFVAKPPSSAFAKPAVRTGLPQQKTELDKESIAAATFAQAPALSDIEEETTRGQKTAPRLQNKATYRAPFSHHSDCRKNSTQAELSRPKGFAKRKVEGTAGHSHSSEALHFQERSRIGTHAQIHMPRGQLKSRKPNDLVGGPLQHDESKQVSIVPKHLQGVDRLSGSKQGTMYINSQQGECFDLSKSATSGKHLIFASDSE